MRGRTLNNSFIILDEAQNTTPEQMKMFLTRIGFGSRVVVTGDVTQVDVPNGKSGLARPRARAPGHRRAGVRPPRRERRRAPPHRRRHRRGLRARRPTAPRRGGRRCLNLRVPPSAPTRPSMVVGADEQWRRRRHRRPDRGRRRRRPVVPSGPRRAAGPACGGELTLTFVDRDEIAELNAEHLGKPGPTDVLSFPLDDDPTESARPACPCCSATS